MIRTIFKMLSTYLALAMMLITLPSQGWAMFIPSGNTERHADMTMVRKMLESRVVHQRLTDLGLSGDQAAARMNKLTDEQLHRFASRLDSVQAGADTVDALVIVLLAAILVVGILELTGHSVIVR